MSVTILWINTRITQCMDNSDHECWSFLRPSQGTDIYTFCIYIKYCSHKFKPSWSKPILQEMFFNYNVIPYFWYFRDRFKEICTGNVKVPGMIVMKDVAIVKSEFMDGEKAINKVQDFQHDPVLFEYCAQPEVITHLANWFMLLINVEVKLKLVTKFFDFIIFSNTPVYRNHLKQVRNLNINIYIYIYISNLYVIMMLFDLVRATL